VSNLDRRVIINAVKQWRQRLCAFISADSSLLEFVLYTNFVIIILIIISATDIMSIYCKT